MASGNIRARVWWRGLPLRTRAGRHRAQRRRVFFMRCHHGIICTLVLLVGMALCACGPQMVTKTPIDPNASAPNNDTVDVAGRYILQWGYAPARPIGTLSLGPDGTYAVQLSGPAPALATARFYFLAHPRGRYALDTSVRAVPIITFYTTAVDAVDQRTQRYQIRSDPKTARLFFHATVSEFQTWAIERRP